MCNGAAAEGRGLGACECSTTCVVKKLPVLHMKGHMQGHICMHMVCLQPAPDVTASNHTVECHMLMRSCKTCAPRVCMVHCTLYALPTHSVTPFAVLHMMSQLATLSFACMTLSKWSHMAATVRMDTSRQLGRSLHVRIWIGCWCIASVCCMGCFIHSSLLQAGTHNS